jgi:hypothetical protein
LTWTATGPLVVGRARAAVVLPASPATTAGSLPRLELVLTDLLTPLGEEAEAYQYVVERVLEDGQLTDAERIELLEAPPSLG